MYLESPIILYMMKLKHRMSDLSKIIQQNPNRPADSKHTHSSDHPFFIWAMIESMKGGCCFGGTLLDTLNALN